MLFGQKRKARKEEELRRKQYLSQRAEVKKLAEEYVHTFNKALGADVETVDWPALYLATKEFKSKLFNYPQVCEAEGINVYELSAGYTISLFNGDGYYHYQASDWYTLDEVNKKFAYENRDNELELYDTFSVALLHTMINSVRKDLRIAEKLAA